MRCYNGFVFLGFAIQGCLGHSSLEIIPRFVMGDDGTMMEGTDFGNNVLTIGDYDDYDIYVTVTTDSKFKLWKVECYGSNRTLGPALYDRNVTGSEDAYASLNWVDKPRMKVNYLMVEDYLGHQDWARITVGGWDGGNLTVPTPDPACDGALGNLTCGNAMSGMMGGGNMMDGGMTGDDSAADTVPWADTQSYEYITTEEDRMVGFNGFVKDLDMSFEPSDAFPLDDATGYGYFSYKVNGMIAEQRVMCAAFHIPPQCVGEITLSAQFYNNKGQAYEGLQMDVSFTQNVAGAAGMGGKGGMGSDGGKMDGMNSKDMADGGDMGGMGGMMMGDTKIEFDGASPVSMDLKVYKVEGGYVARLDLGPDTSFVYDPEEASGNHRPGHGHTHVYLNGRKLGRAYCGLYFVSSGDVMYPKMTTLKVTMYANDHAAYIQDGKPLSKSVMLADAVPFPSSATDGGDPDGTEESADVGSQREWSRVWVLPIAALTMFGWVY